MKFICLLGTLFLLGSAAAHATCNRQDAEPIIRIMKSVKHLKDPHTLESINSMSDFAELLSNLSRSALGFSTLPLERMKEFFDSMEQISTVFLELLKASLPEGAKPSEEELVNLAKKASKTIRNLKESHQLTDGFMDDKTLAAIKKVAHENPVLLSGNRILDKLETESPKIHSVASAIKSGMKDPPKPGHPRVHGAMDILQILSTAKESNRLFLRYFIKSELVHLLANEKTAIAIYKEIGAFMSAWKNSSSYESLDALYNSVAKNKRLEAYAILLRKVRKCIETTTGLENNPNLLKARKTILEVTKAILADGVENREELIIEFACNYAANLLGRLYPQGKPREEAMDKCLLTNEDRVVFKEALQVSEPVFKEEQLSQIREKNEKVYAVIRLVNGIVKALRRRNGLGAEAEAFFKEYMTTGHELLRLAERFNPSAETREMIQSTKTNLINKYNNLSNQAKDDLIDVFPYRSVIGMATLQ